MIGRNFLSLSLMCIVTAIINCASWQNQQGVVNKWRDDSLPPIEIGKTSQSDVMKLLGPPSQIIGLKEQVIFYYMLEKTEGQGAFLILINWSNEKIKYDRAIFFFDKNGVLDDYAYSLEQAAFETMQ
jgi:outer membrane protein assembly factor BamE (lipoprotein component of BamABCDE complex)